MTLRVKEFTSHDTCSVTGNACNTACVINACIIFVVIDGDTQLSSLMVIK